MHALTATSSLPPPFPRPPAEMHGGRAPPASSAGGAASSPSPLANPASHSAPHRAMNAPSATTPTSVASAASDAAGPPPRASLDASLASSDDLGVALASVRSELDEMRRARRSADASLEARLGEALPTLKDLVANEMRAEMDAAVAREVRAALERERRGGDPLERPLVDLGGVSGEPSERTAGDEKGGGGSSVATSRATLDEARVEALAEAKCMAIITAQIVPRVGESLRKLDARLTAAEAAVREGSAAVRDRQPTPSSASPPLDAVRADLDELRVRVAELAEASAAAASADPSAASTEASAATSAALEAVRRDVETLRGETNARLDEVIAAADLGPRASDDETEKKMSSLSARVAALEARATDAGARDAANVDAALAAAFRAGERVETVERGLEGVSRGLEGVSRGFDALERRLESLEASSSAAAKVSSADAETDARVAALELALATSTSATEALIEEKLQSLAKTRDDGGATASGENDGVAANVASLSLELAALGERVSAASSEASDARARVAALATAVESEVLPEMETLDDRSSRLAAEGDRRDARVEDVEGVARGAREAALRAERHAATALARADARDFGRAEFSARLDRAESALDACVAGLERVERTSADSIAAVLNVVNSERDAARETTRELEHAIRRAFGDGDEKNAQGPGGRRRARRGGGGGFDGGRTNDAGGFGTPGGGDGTREDRVRSPTEKESNEGGFRFRSLFRRGNGNGGGDPGSAGASPRPSPSPSPSPSPGRKPPGRRESNY